MRNRSLSVIRGSIPYVKELRAVAKTMTGCIIMQQLDYWFARHTEGFYKFLEPCGSPYYKERQSWAEEIGCSAEEFTTAFEKIGIRFKSKTEYEQAEDKFQGLFYCCYFDRSKGLTYYFRNHELVDKTLDSLLSRETDNAGLRKPTTPVSRNQESRFTETDNHGFDIKDSEITSESTQERDKHAPAHEAVRVYEDVYHEPLHIPAQEKIEAEKIDNLGLWREVVSDCYASRNPAYNVGKPLHFYRQRNAQNERAGAPSRAGPRQSNVERGMEAVRNVIAKEQAKNANRP